MKTQCCVCKKVKCKDGWDEAPEHYHDASHTYCPACARDVWAEIRALRACYGFQATRARRAGSMQEMFQSSQPMKYLESKR